MYQWYPRPPLFSLYSRDRFHPFTPLCSFVTFREKALRRARCLRVELEAGYAHTCVRVLSAWRASLSCFSVIVFQSMFVHRLRDSPVLFCTFVLARTRIPGEKNPSYAVTHTHACYCGHKRNQKPAHTRKSQLKRRVIPYCFT